MKTDRQLPLPLVERGGKQGAVSIGFGKASRTLWSEAAGAGKRAVPMSEELRSKAQRLADALRGRLGYGVRVLVTDNRSSLVTARWDDRARAYVFRVHHMFLDADGPTVDALSDFGSGRRKKTAGSILDAYIDRNRGRIRKDPAAGPRAPAPPKGRYHDLQAIFDRLNAEYFDGRVVARIGWGESRGHGRRRRSIKMGSYVHDARLIRVHPALDRPEVPGYYVAWVVYHEMLHQVVPPVRRNGRTYFHSSEFRRRERGYHDAARAQAWEDSHFDLLLRG